ncbi:MAG: hypothetical protein LC750_00570 [Actinobacteria bacterium]|nr:hypothetical protein [Actinomycetota bacterium]
MAELLRTFFNPRRIGNALHGFAFVFTWLFVVVVVLAVVSQIIVRMV